jgi:phenylacetate-coenzyme A ligase PaaK-like adenylate-forming protein
MQKFEDRIFSIRNKTDFDSLAMEIFLFQAKENPIYSEYLIHLNIKPEAITIPEEIPFLPIEFFKTQKLISGQKKPKLEFHSSGTTGQKSSKHYIVSEKLYQKSFLKTFSSIYGDPKEFCFLALLPSYLERENSSLVYMMDYLIKISENNESGFYLNELDELSEILNKRSKDRFPTILIGISYALLDLAEQYPMKLSENVIVMETGGMKGQRKEMIREELHATLKNGFGIANIHSEYGMTELLSQAYSKSNGLFVSPPWMKIFARDIYDPLTIYSDSGRGAINIIDLANLYSCSFIATGDLGNVYETGEFEISGRLDNSEVRGCNLMLI